MRRYPEYGIGNLLRLEGVIERPESLGEFDYVSYLAREDIFAVMAFPQIEKLEENKGPWLATILSRVKEAFEANIDAVLPEPHAALLKGLTLGERESLPQELVEDFRRTGTSHIVALSGYNITLVGRFFTNILLFATVPFHLAFWTAASAIVLFVLLTGASASVVRAGIMGVLVLAAEKEGRMYQMQNALAFAAAAMIFHNPYVLRFDAGFQLSFLATLGLIYLSPVIGRWIDGIRSKLSPDRSGLSLERDIVRTGQQIFPFRKILIETIAAQLAVLPLLIYLFGQVSVTSPIINVLVLMAVPYAMGLGFITGGLGFLWWLISQPVAWLNWILLEYMLRVIGFFSKLPLAAIKLGASALTFLTAIYVLMGWLAWRKLK